MIEAIEIKCGQFVVRSCCPLSGKVLETARVFGSSEALRLAHFWNRTYIIDTMTRWLHQRYNAYHAPGFERHRQIAARLLTDFVFHSQSSVSNIKKLIKQNIAAIESIAPAQHSRQYPYYSKAIRSIINFCLEPEVVNE